MPPLRDANISRQAKATDRPAVGTKTAINLPLYAHDVGTRAAKYFSTGPWVRCQALWKCPLTRVKSLIPQVLFLYDRVSRCNP